MGLPVEVCYLGRDDTVSSGLGAAVSTPQSMRAAASFRRWKQPSRFVIPWWTVDALNFKQWLDKWNFEISRLKQSKLAL